YKTSRTIDELRGFESLTRHFAIADREQPTGLGGGGGGGGGGGSGSSVATAETSATPSHKRRLLGIEATAARRLLTLPTLDRSGGSCARDCLQPGTGGASGAAGSAGHLASGDRQSAAARLGAALLVLAWHRGASERLARDPGSCAAALCSVLSEAAKSSSTSSGQVPQPFPLSGVRTAGPG
uniref:WASH-7_N domain-containing protein n=1 Tax=Macrostomum lignano TaxID=282301 RepID=A0A1I8IZ69_9PLAT